jgi:excisionase family DNA binding protein
MLDVVEFIDDNPIPVIVDIDAAAISPDTPKLLFTRKEAGYSLGLSLRSISTLLKNGTLKFRKVGTRTLIPHQELVRFSKTDHDLA